VPVSNPNSVGIDKLEGSSGKKLTTSRSSIHTRISFFPLCCNSITILIIFSIPSYGAKQVIVYSNFLIFFTVTRPVSCLRFPSKPMLWYLSFIYVSSATACPVSTDLWTSKDSTEPGHGRYDLYQKPRSTRSYTARQQASLLRVLSAAASCQG
jgi:hypothetical protein